MSEKQESSEGIVDKIKDKLDHHKDDETGNNPDRKGDATGEIESDRHFVKPQPFQSKEAPKDNETFFVSRINKPVKYQDRPSFIKYLIYRISKDDASGLAAQLAYYFMLSLFPMLIFILSLVPLFNIDRKTIVNQISENAPADAASIVTSIIDDIMGNASGSILSIGLILALWTASNGMTALMNSFNVAYDVEDSRNFIVSKALAVAFTLILGVTLPLTMVLFTFGEQIGNLLFGPLGLDEQVRWIFSIIRTALPVIAIFVTFTVLYTAAPNVKIKLKSVLPGALFSTVVWILGTLAFGYYVSNFGNYSKTYGSIGGVIVLMLWLYITGFILIIGAEINAIIYQRKVVKGKTPEEQTYDELEAEHEQELAESYNNYDAQSKSSNTGQAVADASSKSSQNVQHESEVASTDYTAPEKVERDNDGYSRHIKTTKD
ncbi:MULTISPECIES: YihY/virulence factor BrkB family protein [unclassified Staphylococcus]|uniref:YihY/virulence factor BrkB family protein n=1 Tax=unclassified Staphylococcus TaxID=91994 RepID=UPI0021D2F52A|nr:MULTISPECIES: YihY/virulence factor BrkB family protein [unclassified Staphylococcus]UXR71035.1 YihY/virulence factor BrkB family protein [Staphylococcus sp. IVB6240]UXR73261.1 YihY/virulence factor BrkB family protein [Staphylococcus sp. IVB6238]UXR75560.1 YihY/virulence factor BrkB family protein [Staphylococcus sp. IVB6233]UXR79761.1 YihY/virulence factor BrkB family protein [Staphylococcus sp. IVB6218]